MENNNNALDFELDSPHLGKMISLAPAEVNVILATSTWDNYNAPSYRAFIIGVRNAEDPTDPGSIPWDYPEDRKWFQKCTTNGVLIMGHKTYLSLPASITKGEKGYKGLGSRYVIVLTSKPEEFIAKIDPVVHKNRRLMAAPDLDGALKLAYFARELRVDGEVIPENVNFRRPIWICGGKELYETWMKNPPIQDCKIFLTSVPCLKGLLLDKVSVQLDVTKQNLTEWGWDCQWGASKTPAENKWIYFSVWKYIPKVSIK